jgi:hypothetical protein
MTLDNENRIPYIQAVAAMDSRMREMADVFYRLDATHLLDLGLSDQVLERWLKLVNARVTERVLVAAKMQRRQYADICEKMGIDLDSTYEDGIGSLPSVEMQAAALVMFLAWYTAALSWYVTGKRRYMQYIEGALDDPAAKLQTVRARHIAGALKSDDPLMNELMHEFNADVAPMVINSMKLSRVEDIPLHDRLRTQTSYNTYSAYAAAADRETDFLKEIDEATTFTLPMHEDHAREAEGHFSFRARGLNAKDVLVIVGTDEGGIKRGIGDKTLDMAFHDIKFRNRVREVYARRKRIYEQDADLWPLVMAVARRFQEGDNLLDNLLPNGFLKLYNGLIIRALPPENATAWIMYPEFVRVTMEEVETEGWRAAQRDVDREKRITEREEQGDDALEKAEDEEVSVEDLAIDNLMIESFSQGLTDRQRQALQIIEDWQGEGKITGAELGRQMGTSKAAGAEMMRKLKQLYRDFRTDE